MYNHVCPSLHLRSILILALVFVFGLGLVLDCCSSGLQLLAKSKDDNKLSYKAQISLEVGPGLKRGETVIQVSDTRCRIQTHCTALHTIADVSHPHTLTPP